MFMRLENDWRKQLFSAALYSYFVKCVIKLGFPNSSLDITHALSARMWAGKRMQIPLCK